MTQQNSTNARESERGDGLEERLVEGEDGREHLLEGGALLLYFVFMCIFMCLWFCVYVYVYVCVILYIYIYVCVCVCPSLNNHIITRSPFFTSTSIPSSSACCTNWWGKASICCSLPATPLPSCCWRGPFGFVLETLYDFKGLMQSV